MGSESSLSAQPGVLTLTHRQHGHAAENPQRALFSCLFSLLPRPLHEKMERTKKRREVDILQTKYRLCVKQNIDCRYSSPRAHESTEFGFYLPGEDAEAQAFGAPGRGPSATH